MNELGRKQREFASKFPLLILFALSLGYEVTFPPEHENHMDDSLHYIGLAKDINLFKNGTYLTNTEDYKQLGLFWESLGGTWGGRFNDGNHFSITYGGRK